MEHAENTALTDVNKWEADVDRRIARCAYSATSEPPPAAVFGLQEGTAWCITLDETRS
jgi:hypothetical protein